MKLTSIRDLDLARLRQRTFHLSPAAWEDQVLYFLLLDRFSDDRETGYRARDQTWVHTGTTPAFQDADAGNAVGSESDAAAWRDAGARFCGGNLRGLTGSASFGGGTWKTRARSSRFCRTVNSVSREKPRDI